MSESYFHSHLTPVGWLEIKTSGRYVQAVKFSDDKNENSLHLPPVMKQCILQLDEYFEGKRKTFELELFPSGTTFQLRTWDELIKIPYGETISYFELAKRIGNVKSVRAAGHAIGQNPISIIIPCHRVIGSDEKLVGYSGGLKNKMWLLDHEVKISKKKLKLF